ncbi:hypothetical protein HII31_03259 [Pseudocercospora fuligena]|uniref:Uncharacterized protein n=1 Tax=Pseudocercospora fuligena TaxID=685502 RepID=A0A8H6RR95_9PEZI|nr:hypothetical protein HII31_03259 [Pseudocercospora fuligena]
MDWGKFWGDRSEIRNPVFTRAASHIKSFLVNFADWESWEEYVSERNQPRGITMRPTRNNSGWYGVAWHRWLRELASLEHFEIKGCAEDRSRIIECLCGPVLKHVGHFAKLRHLSIEADDYFRFPQSRSDFGNRNKHFYTEHLQNFILAHCHTLEEVNLDMACGRPMHDKTLSVNERRSLLLAIRDQCTALKSLKIQEWVQLQGNLGGPRDLESYLSWRRRLEAGIPIVQLAMEFGAKRIFDDDEDGNEVLEEMSAEQTEVDRSGVADRGNGYDEHRVPECFCYRFDLAALRATIVAG